MFVNSKDRVERVSVLCMLYEPKPCLVCMKRTLPTLFILKHFQRVHSFMCLHKCDSEQCKPYRMLFLLFLLLLLLIHSAIPLCVCDSFFVLSVVSYLLCAKNVETVQKKMVKKTPKTEKRIEGMSLFFSHVFEPFSLFIFYLDKFIYLLLIVVLLLFLLAIFQMPFNMR